MILIHRPKRCFPLMMGCVAVVSVGCSIGAADVSSATAAADEDPRSLDSAVMGGDDSGIIAGSAGARLVPMYRADNANADYHFFTTSLREFCSVVRANFANARILQGDAGESSPVPFRVFDAPFEGTTAIYRL